MTVVQVKTRDDVHVCLNNDAVTEALRDVLELVATEYKGNLIAYVKAIQPHSPEVREKPLPVEAFAARLARSH